MEYPVRERPALRHEPGVQVFAAGTADGDDAAAAVNVALLARDSLLPDIIEYVASAYAAVL